MAYGRETSFKKVLYKGDRNTSFENGWKLAQNRFFTFRKLCVALSTAFSGTKTVESDLSIVNLEKDNDRVSLTYFYLKGILPAKQFRQMRSIKFKKDIIVGEVQFCETGPGLLRRRT